MKFPQKLFLVCTSALLAIPAFSQVGAQAVVQKISVSAENPVQVQVQTSSQVTPQAQIISDPERLVIDVPSATPGPSLHNQNLNRDEVERVRVGLFSKTPPITRIVLDLKAPQWYRITPTASGFTVSLGASAPTTESAVESAKTVGWISSKTVAINVARSDPFTIKRSPNVALPNGVRVQFDRGQLEIHARNATLSEVLFQIQRQTGAEIAIPAGTEQERVAADLGPGPASVVLAGLLNGSDLNFVVVGSEADPSALRSVILSHKGAGFAEYIPSPNQATVADNNNGNSTEIQPQVEPRPEDIPQQPDPNAASDQPPVDQPGQDPSN